MNPPTHALLEALETVADTVIGGDGYAASWERNGSHIVVQLVEATDQVTLWIDSLGDLERVQWGAVAMDAGGTTGPTAVQRSLGRVLFDRLAYEVVTHY